MTQAQFLLLIIAIIPLVNCLVIRFCDSSISFANIVSKTSPVFFLAALVGLYGSVGADGSYLTISQISKGLSFGFGVDGLAINFLFFLDFLWLVFVFYSHRFLSLGEVKNINNSKLFFALIIALVNLIIISKNLLTILFLYNALVILCHFFAAKFLYKNVERFSKLFTFLLYFESIFFFLAIVGTYKISGQIDFVSGGIILDDSNPVQHVILLISYFVGLFLSILFPSYLIYRETKIDPIFAYALFFLAYALSSIYILIKLLGFTFGFELFASIMHKIGFEVFEWIFLINIIIASSFLIFSKSLKSAFFYLFFQQFIFTLLEIFIFAIFNKAKIGIAFLSFSLSLTLILFSISNFILYLNKSEEKEFYGLFYSLKVNTILFIFAGLNMLGVAPGVGVVEKFFLIKILLKKKLVVSAIAFVINIMSLAIFMWKICYPLFLNPQKTSSQTDITLAKNIDFDSNLTLPSFVIALSLVLLLVFFPLLELIPNPIFN